jgi:hypothetical protein
MTGSTNAWGAPGPLAVSLKTDRNGRALIEDANGDPVASVAGETIPGQMLLARRLVACFNACDDPEIDMEGLEDRRLSPRELIDASLGAPMRTWTRCASSWPSASLPPIWPRSCARRCPT